MKFNAIYYDGRTSFGSQAEIELGYEGIQIAYDDILITWYEVAINKEQSYISGKKVVLKYGPDFPHQVLEIESDSFVNEFNNKYPERALKSLTPNFFNSISTKFTLAILAGIVGFIILSYFVLIPGIAEQVAKAFPKEYEISLGETIYAHMEKDFDVDTAKTALANEFFNDLHISSAYPIRITVVNSEIENAFALPGGHIVVYSKMFDIMKSKDEFVALLCHEYSHIANKHTTRNLFRSLSTYFVISLFLNDVNGITAVIIDNANQLKSLSFSRSLEEEADTRGLALMIKRGISPDGMIQLFEHLQNATKDRADVPEFLSTHPIIDSRVENVKKIERETTIYPKPHVDLKVIWDKIQKLD